MTSDGNKTSHLPDWMDGWNHLRKLALRHGLLIGAGVSSSELERDSSLRRTQMVGTRLVLQHPPISGTGRQRCPAMWMRTCRRMPLRLSAFSNHRSSCVMVVCTTCLSASHTGTTMRLSSWCPPTRAGFFLNTRSRRCSRMRRSSLRLMV